MKHQLPHVILMYADDLVVLCEVEEIQIRHLRAILTILEGISGLHVNWNKSSLFPIKQVDKYAILS